MASPFDPNPRLASWLHASVCPDHVATVAAGDCPTALDAVTRWREQFLDAGLVALPLEVVAFVASQFRLALDPGDDAGDGSLPARSGRASGTGDGVGSEAPSAGEPPAATIDLYRAPTLLVCRMWDGSEERLGPWARPLAEAILVDFNWTHDPGVVAARLEPEAAWIGHLLDGLSL